MSATQELEGAVDPRSLSPVPVAILQNCNGKSFDIYTWPNKRAPPRLYRERNTAMTPNDLRRLVEQGIETLYINLADVEQFCAEILADESVPVADRYGMLRDAARAVIVSSLEKADVDGMLHVSTELGSDMVQLICGRKNVVNDLLSVMTHDYSTFTHIANVCTYCVILAEAMGISDRKQLGEIAQGALMHDLGKCFVSAQILNKAGQLTNNEREIIRLHPTRGFEQLCQRTDVTWGQLMMVYQHHEQCDGNGYPAGLVGEEIHPWARICAVTDVFDALTRDRAYRKGATRAEVLSFLQAGQGRHFDKEACQCWIALME